MLFIQKKKKVCLVQNTSNNVGGGFAHTAVDILDLLRGDIRNIGHQVRNLALRVRELLVDVVVRKNVGNAEQDSGNVHVGVAQTDRVFFIADSTQIDLGEVDRANGGAVVNE